MGACYSDYKKAIIGGVVALILSVLLIWMGFSTPFEENPLERQREDTPVTLALQSKTVEYTTLKAKNPDLAGWLTVPGTFIDRPVFQRSDNDYYLSHDENGQLFEAGSLFFDYDNIVNQGAGKLSPNTIVYGHNLGDPKTGKNDPNSTEMFASLLRFSEGTFAKENPYFYLYIADQPLVCEIFSVAYVERIMKPVSYVQMAHSQAQFGRLIADFRARSLYHYNVPVNTDDRIVIISTCSFKYSPYSLDPNERFVVVARVMDEKEPRYKTADLEHNKNWRRGNWWWHFKRT